MVVLQLSMSKLYWLKFFILNLHSILFLARGLASFFGEISIQRRVEWYSVGGGYGQSSYLSPLARAQQSVIEHSPAKPIWVWCRIDFILKSVVMYNQFQYKERVGAKREHRTLFYRHNYKSNNVIISTSQVIRV